MKAAHDHRDRLPAAELADRLCGQNFGFIVKHVGR
jgi:hypothetical protein